MVQSLHTNKEVKLGDSKSFYDEPNGQTPIHNQKIKEA